VTLFGHFQFLLHSGRPYIIGNVVTTLDGVVSLGVPGHEGGGDISGGNQHDHLVMRLLRAMAEAVIVGVRTLHASPQHRWTAEYIYPPLSAAYQQLRYFHLLNWEAMPT
jgi:hypothetical protein